MLDMPPVQGVHVGGFVSILTGGSSILRRGAHSSLRDIMNHDQILFHLKRGSSPVSPIKLSRNNPVTVEWVWSQWITVCNKRQLGCPSYVQRADMEWKLQTQGVIVDLLLGGLWKVLKSGLQYDISLDSMQWYTPLWEYFLVKPRCVPELWENPWVSQCVFC